MHITSFFTSLIRIWKNPSSPDFDIDLAHIKHCNNPRKTFPGTEHNLTVRKQDLSLIEPPAMDWINEATCCMLSSAGK